MLFDRQKAKFKMMDRLFLVFYGICSSICKSRHLNSDFSSARKIGNKCLRKIGITHLGTGIHGSQGVHNVPGVHKA